MMRMVGMEVEWGCPQEGERGRWIKMMTCGHHRVKTQYVYMCNTCDTSEQEINQFNMSQKWRPVDSTVYLCT